MCGESGVHILHSSDSVLCAPHCGEVNSGRGGPVGVGPCGSGHRGRGGVGRGEASVLSESGRLDGDAVQQM